MCREKVTVYCGINKKRYLIKSDFVHYKAKLLLEGLWLGIIKKKVKMTI